MGSTLLLVERVLEAAVLGADVDGRPEGANDGLEDECADTIVMEGKHRRALGIARLAFGGPELEDKV